MTRHSDKARENLLDSAEELFARRGIDAVSNRQIAENAGSANHSAIAYHFGSRDHLLRALLSRHLEPMNARQQELLAELGADASVHDIVRCRLLPFVEVLDALPSPSWRAQFLFQMRTVPSTVVIIDEFASSQGLSARIESMIRRTQRVPEAVLRARSGILGHLVLGVCSEHEAQVNQGIHRGNWMQVGHFLIDAAAGMLSAPMTGQTESIVLPESPSLV